MNHRQLQQTLGLTDPQPVNFKALPSKSGRPRRSRRARTPAFLLLILLLGSVLLIHTHKKLPAGLSYEGAVHRVDRIEFLYDLSYTRSGVPVHEQLIFNRILKAVDEADRFIVLDLFLFNGYADRGQTFPQVSAALTDRLIARKQAVPGLEIILITDEVNTTYGSHSTPELDRLRAADIPVVITDVGGLRDSTPLYSAVWRTFFQWFGQSGSGWLPNPMANEAPKVTLRSYLKLFNVKANHRKVVVTEDIAIVSSGNVHDASAYHSNTAFAAGGGLIADVLVSEQAAARMSQGPSLPEAADAAEANGGSGAYRVRLLTEGQIYRHVLESLNQASAGDKVWLGMFYLADAKVKRALLGAAERGAEVRLILDPNQNAFGNKKIGIPNRPVAAELLEQSHGRIQIRWYNTKEEQYHTKMLVIAGHDKTVIHSGSANFTPRNLDDLNLETNVEIEAPSDSSLSGDVLAYFDRLWSNRDGRYTLDYEVYRDETGPLRRWLYHLQNLLGFTTY